MISMEDIEAASSEMNLYYAGQHYGRTPTPVEAVRYYLEHTPRIRTFVVEPLFRDLEEVSGEQIFADPPYRKYRSP